MARCDRHPASSTSSAAGAAVALLCATLLFLGPRPARAGETDFLPDNLSWNGLSELADIARGLQLQLQLVEELDWRDLPPRGTLFVIYPRALLDPLDVLRFIGRGGTLLLADDFGAARPLLEKLGISRRDGPPQYADRHHQGNPNLPVAWPGPEHHELTSGVREIVTNHPAVFLSALPTVAGFGATRREQLLVVGVAGHGRYVALADPSVLINGMLRFEGNMRLATNLVRQLAPRQGNVVHLVTGSFRVAGRLADGPPPEAPSPRAQRFLKEYNSFLGHLNDYALTEPALRTLAMVVGSLGLVGLFLFLPLPRRELDGHWLRPQGAAHASFEDQVERYERRRWGGGSTVPAALLREEVEDLLAESLAAPGPISTIHPSWVVQQVRQRAGEEAGQLCARLLGLLKQIPHGARDQLVGGVGARDLGELYDLSRTLLSRLGSRTLPALTRTNDGPADR